MAYGVRIVPARPLSKALTPRADTARAPRRRPPWAGAITSTRSARGPPGHLGVVGHQTPCSPGRHGRHRAQSMQPMGDRPGPKRRLTAGIGSGAREFYLARTRHPPIYRVAAPSWPRSRGRRFLGESHGHRRAVSQDFSELPQTAERTGRRWQSLIGPTSWRPNRNTWCADHCSNPEGLHNYVVRNFGAP